MEASDQGGNAEQTDVERETQEAAPEESIEGSQGEQVAVPPPGVDQSTPVRTSAPAPGAQSGVPLQEDRDAGVEPGPVAPGDESGDDRPEGADQTAPSAAEPTE